jgi:hypothetical protein
VAGPDSLNEPFLCDWVGRQLLAALKEMPGHKTIVDPAAVE